MAESGLYAVPEERPRHPFVDERTCHAECEHSIRLAVAAGSATSHSDALAPSFLGNFVGRKRAVLAGFILVSPSTFGVDPALMPEGGNRGFASLPGCARRQAHDHAAGRLPANWPQPDQPDWRRRL